MAKNSQQIPPRLWNTFQFIIYINLEFLQDIINQHEESYDQEDLRDFIDAFLKKMKKAKGKDFSVKLKKRHI